MLTNNSVAEIAEKPLYRVTCGDIGTEPEQVEDYLESVLHLGKTWGCVVLLDEADVFLEQRGLEDLKRNALVSVFLRVLEVCVLQKYFLRLSFLLKQTQLTPRFSVVLRRNSHPHIE